MPEIIYEKEGEEVRMYEDRGVVDKQGRINELNAAIISKNQDVSVIEAEIDAMEAEITTLEGL